MGFVIEEPPVIAIQDFSLENFHANVNRQLRRAFT
jgi:hypothetical protein